MLNAERPIVMTLAGHDPTGGAGIQADLEAISYTGCYPVSVVTCLTVQDTHNVQSICPLDADYILQQAETVLADMHVKIFKIGLLGSAEIVKTVSKLLNQHKDIPVIFDPVLAAGGGKDLSTSDLIDTIKTDLLPLVTLLTPNIPEAVQLGIIDKLDDDNTIHLKDQVCKNILITGAHADSARVENHLYHNSELIDESSWDRLEHEYHGSGCTLASNIAGWMAQGFSVKYAVQRGQEFTWNSLKRAQKLGGGQLIPYRI